ncbi:type I polyketide synthase [Actinocorallia longicatena]|uniref:type I polyketide synthase n=1 Tax=Actinocorallia longicatena TaxID=111803 RepID=UPI0031D2AEC7
MDAPTEKVDWSSGSVRLLAEERSWPETGRPRRAAVSSFGISGTNAHVILEQAPEQPGPENPPPVVDGTAAWVLSARTPEALRTQAERLAEHVEEHPELAAADIGFTLAHRPVLEYRAVAIGDDHDELLAGVIASAQGTPAPKVTSGRVPENAATGKTAFVFPGQGAQWSGMGRELYTAFPPFAQAFDEVLAALAQHSPHTPEELREVLWADAEGRMRQTGWAQPALFAVEVALYRLVRAWGVSPDALLGHSVGEIAAAHVAGVLTLPDAARLVMARARLMQALPEGGAMLAIRAAEADVKPLLVAGVDIAAVNSPRSVVVSGAEAGVDEVAARATDAGHRTERLAVSHAFHSPLMEPMLDAFAGEVARLSFAEPEIPLVRDLSGDLAATGDDPPITSPHYWVRHAREAVRFAAGIGTLASAGVRRFMVLGPDGGLTNLIGQCLDHIGTPEETTTTAGLRDDRSETTAVLTALAGLFAAGAPVDWRAVSTAAGGRWADLPTYPFQHRRYWLPTPPSTGDASEIGQRPAEHPLLGAIVRVPGSEQIVLTGRLSLRAQPWLADHAILGRVVVPGAAFVEMALRAAEQVDRPRLRELTFQAPLVLPTAGGADMSVVLAPDPTGAEPDSRTLAIYSRPSGTDDAEWVLHARGILDAEEEPSTGTSFPQWPPADAETVDVADAYAALADRGYAYGPALRGVRALWRRGTDVFAEVAVPEEAGQATGFGMHPALLDAVSHAALLADPGEEDTVGLPFAWEGLRLHTAGSSVLRVLVSPAGAPGAVSLRAVDQAGRPVLSARSFTTRPVSAQRLGAAAGPGLQEVAWSPIPAPVTPAPATEVVVVESAPVSGGVVAAVHAATGRVLGIVQAWLADERHAEARLVIVTRGAVALPGEDVEDLAGAAVWGLVRAAQSEHPGRFVLADGDTAELGGTIAAASASGEPQVVIRSGVLYAPRLVRTGRGGPAEEPPDLSGGTVLVTGGLGGLGAVVARHLVASGAGRVLLASRRGAAAPGAEDLLKELSAGGARVDVTACDVSDRDAVLDLVADVAGSGFPLVGVVHAAGVLDDGVVETLTQQRLDAVLRAKADGAWYLHEATHGMGLRLFALFSSLAGVVGSAGQANYAAANAFLDALSAHRRASGRAGVSIAWGPWADSGGMAERLSGADAARLDREGVRSLSAEEGLALFDTAVAQESPQVVAARWNTRTLRAHAAAGTLPPLLAGLVPAAQRSHASAAAGEDLRRRLTDLDETDQRQIVTDLVLLHAALVLGHSGGADIDPGDPFEKLGLDSLGAVQIRNRITGATGLRLPVTAIYDYPTPAALAAHLYRQLAPEAVTASGTRPSLRDVRRLLNSVRPVRPGDSEIVQALLDLAEAKETSGGPPASAKRDAIREMDTDSLIAMGLGIANDRKDEAG